MSQIDHHVTGVEYWRSLEQLADTPEVRGLIEQEFPNYDANAMASTSRRKFLKLMGASMALAGVTLTGCRRWPQEKLAPYTSNPNGTVPGGLEQYATSWELGGMAQGLLVTSFDGRPIKIEGNPSHPFSWTVKDKIGGTGTFAQASILDMYDPQRSRAVIWRSGNEIAQSTWEKFTEFAAGHFASIKGKGEGFAILSETSNGPSALDMKKRMLAQYPQAKWFEYEPLSMDAELDGTKQVYGKALRNRLHLDKANVVVLLDADLFGSHPAHVRYSSDWAQRRRGGDRGDMNRVFIAESTFSVTGAVADVRIAVDPTRIYVIARAIAAGVGAAGITGAEKLSEVEKKFVDSAVAELKGPSGTGLVAAGAAASPTVHALVCAINEKIGAVGKTVTLVEESGAADRPSHFAGIKSLAADMAAGKISTLLIIGGNPVYDAPSDTEFTKALAKVATSIRLGLYLDETSKLCTWHLPRAHYLECWGDGRSLDGTVSLQQPLIEPLYAGKSPIELLAMLSNDKVTAGEKIVQRAMAAFIKGADFEKQWRRALEIGVVANSTPVAATFAFKPVEFPAADVQPKGLVLRFEPDSHTYDGRFANNGWMQELGDPMTKLVWDNSLNFSVKDAKDLDVKIGDVLRIEANNKMLEAAVFILPGQPVGVIGLSLGYGRTAAGTVGDKTGFNGYILRASSTPTFVSDLKITKLAQTYTLAGTQEHHILDDFATKHALNERIGGKGETGSIVRESTLEDFKKNRKAPHAKAPHPSRLQLFDAVDYSKEPHAWGMAIDLNTCIGCNACVVACQAENNIPIVGKDQVLMHREMHWIRIDRYFKGSPDDSSIQVSHQPMMCVHCENAPCEQVCPVAATVHDVEGLNTMVYNRCIGTRYCSNNCPYKVRRFNYFDFHAKDPRASVGSPWNNLPDKQQNDMVDKIKRMVYNPDVTVRMRGVMEKCSYCVQRIQRTKIVRRNAGQTVKDGDIITACQQVCPTSAITFGNINEKGAAVKTLHDNARAYNVLDDLNTRPRTRYLSKLRNPLAGSTPATTATPHAANMNNATSVTEAQV